MKTSMKKTIVSIGAIYALLCAAASLADDPPQLGMCDSATKKPGDVCATGICNAGKQTVYRCDTQLRCVLQKNKQNCDESKNKKKVPGT